jgi:hypothetical protein
MAWTGSSWTNWEDLGGVLTATPAAVSWGQGRIDIFARGSEGHCWHQWWQDGSGWGTWEDLGGQLLWADFLGTGPAVTSWASGRLDVFVIGATDHYLWHKAWTGSSWTNFEPLYGYLTASPGAVSWGQGRIDVFARGNEGDAWHIWYQNGWGTWEDIGVPVLPTQIVGFKVSVPFAFAVAQGYLKDQNGYGVSGETVSIYYGSSPTNLIMKDDVITGEGGSFTDIIGASYGVYCQARFAGNGHYAPSQSSVVHAT